MTETGENDEREIVLVIRTLSIGTYLEFGTCYLELESTRPGWSRNLLLGSIEPNPGCGSNENPPSYLLCQLRNLSS